MNPAIHFSILSPVGFLDHFIGNALAMLKSPAVQ
jgi:hypothetical protein